MFLLPLFSKKWTVLNNIRTFGTSVVSMTAYLSSSDWAVRPERGSFTGLPSFLHLAMCATTEQLCHLLVNLYNSTQRLS